MPSVYDIARRIAAEGQPWPSNSQRDTRPNPVAVKEKSWLPNRKVVSGLVAGALSWAAFKYLGITDLDPEIESGITVLVMSFISYLVPLSDD